MTPFDVAPATRKAMQGNKSRDTKPEMLLRSILHRRGLRYRVSIRPIPELRRTADLVFTRARVAVFVDGCFWHGCPTHHRLPATNSDYWTAKVERNRQRDREIDQALSDLGWSVVRCWEHDPAPEVAERVIREVASRGPSNRWTR